MRALRATPRPAFATIQAWSGIALAAAGIGIAAGRVASGITGCTGPSRPADPALGRELFQREWRRDDPRSHGGDGLGPLYNANSCVACHGQPDPGGAGVVGMNVDLVSAATSHPTLALSPAERSALVRLHPAFADAPAIVLHHSGTDPGYDAFRRGLLEGEPDDKPLPRRFPRGEFTLTHSRRNSPPLFGVGRIDAVPEALLVKAARRKFPDFPEVHGRVARTQGGKAGRFGWKGQVPDLNEFVLSACAGELGLEVPGHHQARRPGAPVPDSSPRGLDMDGAECADLVAFVGGLPAPVVRPPSTSYEAAAIADGRQAFVAIGCATCHAPSMGPAVGIYSDLLLHDMGQGLSDSGQYYGGSAPADGPLAGATEREWRTPPLWGFRDSGPYLHDGRAETLAEAVALHGGEADRTARRFARLVPFYQSAITLFLESLTAPPEPTRLASDAPPRRPVSRRR